MRNLDQIREALKKTVLPSVHVIPVEDGKRGCTDSKFGGAFYLPEGSTVPMGEDGQEMEFLAQIRFSQTPPLEGFPSEGLLQFFLCTSAETMEEMDAGELQSQGHFRVIYYPEVIEGEHFSYEGKEVEDRWPMEKWERGMRFERTEDVATISVGETDFGYEDAIEMLSGDVIERAGYDLSDCPDTDQFFMDFGNWGCKIGGHPAIRQGDVRYEEEEYEAYTTLLFQMDLSPIEELEGDTFAFFIKPEDLAAGCFEDVLLYWHNCY